MAVRILRGLLDRLLFRGNSTKIWSMRRQWVPGLFFSRAYAHAREKRPGDEANNLLCIKVAKCIPPHFFFFLKTYFLFPPPPPPLGDFLDKALLWDEIHYMQLISLHLNTCDPHSRSQCRNFMIGAWG